MSAVLVTRLIVLPEATAQNFRSGRLDEQAQTLLNLLRGMEDPIEVAVMGCVVNGPGEARGADVGIAGGNGEGLIFRKGEVIRKVKEEELLPELFREIDMILEERKTS